MSRHRLCLFAFLVTLAATHTAAAAAPHSVAGIQAIFPDSVGQVVSLRATYVSPDDPLMFDDYAHEILNEPMPPESYVILDGLIPGAPYAETEIVVEGFLQTRIIPHAYLDDSPAAVIFVTNFSPIGAPEIEHGRGLPTPTDPPPLPAVDCDSCKFSIILSGGVDAARNKPRYWNDVAKKYTYKTGAGYCDTNITVLYYEGVSANTALVPQARVQSATQANFDAQIAAIKAKIQRCKAAGKRAEFQLLVTNHGLPAGICLLGNNLLTNGALKAKVKELVDAGVDDVYAEFGQCYGGAQVDSLKKLADSTNTTGFHLVSASTGSETSYGRRNGQTDVFEDEFIKARSLGLGWGASFAFADSADSAVYANDIAFYSHWNVPQANPQAFESFAKRFTASGQTLEFEVGKKCSTLAVHFPGADDANRCANATIYVEVETPGGKTWKMVRIRNWNVGKKKYFRAWIPGATGRYRIVSNSNGYPTDVRVECIDTKSLPESPTDAAVYNALAVGSRDRSNIEYNPGLGAGSTGSYTVAWTPETSLDQVPAHIGANYHSSLVIDVPLTIDPSRPFLYQGGMLTAPYVNPGVFKVYASDILDPSGVQVPYLTAMLHVYAPSRPSAEAFIAFTLSRGPDQEVLPADIPLPVLYAVPTQFEVLPVDPGTIALDALVLDPFLSTASVPEVEAVGARPRLMRSLPNPFTSETTLRFGLPRSTDVHLAIFDASGRMIRSLARGPFAAGVHAVVWDGRDSGGRRVGSGVYFTLLVADGIRSNGKLMLLR